MDAEPTDSHRPAPLEYSSLVDEKSMFEMKLLGSFAHRIKLLFLGDISYAFIDNVRNAREGNFDARPGMEARSTQKVFGERWLAEIELALCLLTFRGRGSADFLGMSGSEGRNAGGPRDKFLGKLAEGNAGGRTPQDY